MENASPNTALPEFDLDRLWHHECVLSLPDLSTRNIAPIHHRPQLEELQKSRCSSSPAPSTSLPKAETVQESSKHCSQYPLFELMDQNHDGEVSLDEIIGLLSKVGKEVSRSWLASIMQPFDHNHDMSVSFREFTAIYDSIYREEVEMNVEKEVPSYQPKSGFDSEELVDAFNVYDKNKDGYISAAELSEVLQELGLPQGMDLEKCQSLINRVDRDGNGLVDLQEFEAMLNCRGCGISETEKTQMVELPRHHMKARQGSQKVPTDHLLNWCRKYLFELALWAPMSIVIPVCLNLRDLFHGHGKRSSLYVAITTSSSQQFS